MNNINRYSDDVIQINKNEIISLIQSIHREGANLEGLIKKLESSDFFRAPASTKYHGDYVGGLAEHSLNVYYNLKHLVDMKGLNDIITEDNIIICGILHDMSKINTYELYNRNEKVYHENGTKFDNLGKFDWQSVLSFKVKDDNNRFIYGNHEETSEFMISTFIPLEVCESVAILNHHGGMGYDSIPTNTLSSKYVRYPLAPLLHMADFLATYIDEKK